MQTGKKCPGVYDAACDLIQKTFNEIYGLTKLYRLQASTICLFDMIFRHYLSLKLNKILVSCSKIPAFCLFPANAHPKLQILKVDALICLRLAIKMNECQGDMYRK